MTVDVKKYKFGLVGYGFLGTAIAHGFGLHADIKIHDKFMDYDSLEDVVDHAEVIWIGLPTPMDMDSGAIDLSIIDENLEKINARAKPEDKKIIIIKSTVVPGSTRTFALKYPNLTFIMNPEFLTARNNRLDFICASRIIIGADEEWAADKMEEIYRYRFGNSTPIYRCSWEEAELTKYGANCFFAVKISYFNFLYDLCQKLGLDFDKVRDMVLSDGRIGRSHANVPGWDGQRGYSGACFPKDVNALMAYAKEKGVDPKLLDASWQQNLEDRPSRDWEDIKSAVSKKPTPMKKTGINAYDEYDKLQPVKDGATREELEAKAVEVDALCDSFGFPKKGGFRPYFMLKALTGVDHLRSPDIPNCPIVNHKPIATKNVKDGSFWAEPKARFRTK